MANPPKLIPGSQEELKHANIFQSAPLVSRAYRVKVRVFMRSVGNLKSQSEMAHSGRPLLLDEIAEGTGELHGSCLRVVGRLTRHDLRTHICEITHRGVTLQVDLRLLGDSPNVRIGSLFMFIGELEESRKTEEEGFTRILRARVGSPVDGLDMQLYEQSLFEMRNFVKETLATKGS